MKTSNAQKRNGIQWTPWTQLDDLDFADDLALLPHTQQQMQKTTIIATHSACLGLTIHKGKSKILKVNNNHTTPIMLEGEALEEVESFAYLGSVVDKLGGTDADMKVRIRKAKAAFHQLKKVSGFSELPRNTKIRIFNSMLKPVLLYSAETWSTTVTTMKKIQSFINNRLRRILRVRWPNTISTLELWQQTGQQPVEEEILRRCWRWVGHTLQKAASSSARHALFWNPQGK